MSVEATTAYGSIACRQTCVRACFSGPHGVNRADTHLRVVTLLAAAFPYAAVVCGWDSELMQEEMFCPILCVIPYDDLGAAAAQVRARPKPLALYVFSRQGPSADPHECVCAQQLEPT